MIAFRSATSLAAASRSIHVPAAAGEKVAVLILGHHSFDDGSKSLTFMSTLAGNGVTQKASRLAVDAALAKKSDIATRQISESVPLSSDRPTMDMAKDMPTGFTHMNNEILMTLGALNNSAARAEMLKRHIMVVDNVPYTEAVVTFEKISDYNRELMRFFHIPYTIGIAAAVGGGLASIPLVFHRSTVEWFNENYVTADIPQRADLETALEVGSWAWGWMEPTIGELSFLILCMQLARSQMLNIGLRPYTDKRKLLR